MSTGWEQTSHCSWQKGNMQIVKQYKPCKGGTVYAWFDGTKLQFFPSLEAAQFAADQVQLRFDHG